mmetsp:Transcript_14415/g.40965  ORF Transcript_14415/g.40965 Transcript_14415/m.40965 type:complete len:82 (-) Transcript_14415:1517-1762(-)
MLCDLSSATSNFSVHLATTVRASWEPFKETANGSSCRGASERSISYTGDTDVNVNVSIDSCTNGTDRKHSNDTFTSECRVQ